MDYGDDQPFGDVYMNRLKQIILGRMFWQRARSSMASGKARRNHMQTNDAYFALLAQY